MMQIQLLKEVKQAGRFSLDASLSGQIISLSKTLANFSNQVLTIWTDTPLLFQILRIGLGYWYPV